MQYNREEIEKILQCSYYDHRTDYLWKYIMGNRHAPDDTRYPIPNLESFVAMHEMLKTRCLGVSAFLDQWEATNHPGLLDYQYNEQSGILRIKTRSFCFTYRSKHYEYSFAVYAPIAKSINLEKRTTLKRYRRGGLFPVSYLVELDEQLYSRYAEKQKVKVWRNSPQFALDVQYCEAMIPAIMTNAEQRIQQLGVWRRLYIVLSGTDKVKIGIAEDYSPEEIISMSYYPRDKWQEGISAAFTALDIRYAEELAAHTLEIKEWSDELSQIVLGKTTYSIEEQRQNYHFRSNSDDYSQRVVSAALGMPDDDFLTFGNIGPEDLNGLSDVLNDLYSDYQETRQRMKRPLHKQLIDAVRYIIELTAPLIAYNGQNNTIKENYTIDLKVSPTDQIRVATQFSFETSAIEVFELDEIRSRFRAWWSQQLLKECKFAKQCVLAPEQNYPFDHPF